MRVGIIGSRQYENKRKIKEMIFKLKRKFGNDLTIVSGGAQNGADKYARKFALELDCRYLEFNPAHTQRNLYSTMRASYYDKEYHPKYFFQRNTMLAGFVDYLIAFVPYNIPSPGSEHTLREARKKGKKVVIIS
jgi:predicted Rossmann fold nucleotide-binding protein DprA/Smf involved in DNA uptake